MRLGVYLNGLLKTTKRELNLIEGSNVTITVDDGAQNDAADITISSSGSGGGHTIQDDDTAKTARTNLSFQDGFVVTDDSGGDQTEVDLDYGAAGYPLDVADTESDGTAITVARSDHVHSGAAYLKEADFDDVDFLVGTATAHTAAEIVVGTTPGGELGGTWASPTVDATHSGSTHSAATDTHIADTTDVHDHGSLSGLTDDDHTQYLKETDVAAKGDIYAATADNTVGVLTVGANDTVLTADSTQATGLKWATGGSGAPTDAQYVTLATHASLSAERTLAVGDGLRLTDAGANGAATVAMLFPIHVPLMLPTTPSLAYTNQGAGPTELAASHRAILDLTNTEECRCVVSVVTGGTTADLKLQYSTDDSAFSDLTTNLIDLSSTGLKGSTWENVPAGAKADLVVIRVVAVGGNGTEDPAVRNVAVQFR